MNYFEIVEKLQEMYENESMYTIEEILDYCIQTVEQKEKRLV